MPIIGYIPFLKRLHPVHTHLGLKKLNDAYGPVTGVFLGPWQPFVSVTGFKAVREALLNDDLAGRVVTASKKERSFGLQLGNYTDPAFFILSIRESLASKSFSPKVTLKIKVKIQSKYQ